MRQILRLYDAGNMSKNVRLHFAEDITAAYECDMLDNLLKSIFAISKGNSGGKSTAVLISNSVKIPVLNCFGDVWCLNIVRIIKDCDCPCST